MRKATMHFAFDDVYLDALKREDPATWDHFVCCFSKALHAFLRRRLRSTEVIEDATQETLFRVLVYFRAGKTLRAACNLPAFVTSVCTNVSREMLRATAHVVRLAEDFGDTMNVRANPERAAMDEEQARTIWRTLDVLPRKDQRALKSVFLDEADKDQVCRELRINRDHLRVVLHRAKRRFRAAADRQDNGSRSLLKKTAATRSEHG
jgi:RNA polymerase sigma-70 factor (ECF subfamily)